MVDRVKKFEKVLAKSTRTKDYKPALDFCIEWQTDEPNNKECHNALGQVYVGLGKLDLAKAAFARAGAQ